MMIDLPFNQLVNVRKLPKKGQHFSYQADADVCKEIAQAYDLIAISNFSGQCLVAPWKRDGVKLTGVVRSAHSQPCATTGNPLEIELNEEFEALYVPEGSKLSQPQLDGEGELILDPFGDDLPDVFHGDSIDLANVWLEFFALALDPFARDENAEFDKSDLDSGEESPFAALEALRSSMKKQ